MLPGEHGWLVILTAAIAFLAVGVIMLVWPTATLTIVAILIGIALVVTGLMRLFDGFTAKDESGGRRVADVVIGALAVIVGLYCLRHHALSIAIVAFMVGVFWLLYGISRSRGGGHRQRVARAAGYGPSAACSASSPACLCCSGPRSPCCCWSSSSASG